MLLIHPKCVKQPPYFCLGVLSKMYVQMVGNQTKLEKKKPSNSAQTNCQNRKKMLCPGIPRVIGAL